MAKLMFEQFFVKREYILSSNETYIGRSKENNLPIPDYDIFSSLPKEVQKSYYKTLVHISRRHAKISLNGTKFFIVDIGTPNTGSTYGTFINGDRILPHQPCELKDNDKITFGSVECIFKEK